MRTVAIERADHEDHRHGQNQKRCERCQPSPERTEVDDLERRGQRDHHQQCDDRDHEEQSGQRQRYRVLDDETPGVDFAVDDVQPLHEPRHAGASRPERNQEGK